MLSITGNGNLSASGRKNMIREFLMAMETPIERIMIAVRLAPLLRIGFQIPISRRTANAPVARMAIMHAGRKPRFEDAAKNRVK
jgi:hypothetical protein